MIGRFTFVGATLLGGPILGQPATAGKQTVYLYAQDLRKTCYAEPGSGLYGMCFSFVGGILETIANNPIYGMTACLPRLTTIREAGSELVSP